MVATTSEQASRVLAPQSGSLTADGLSVPITKGALAYADGDPASPVYERYGTTGSDVWRQVVMGQRTGPRLIVPAKPRGRSPDAFRSAWDRAWLRGAVPTTGRESHDGLRGPLRVVDLFAGCGAMSFGLKLVAESIGARFEAALAADVEDSALDVYGRNLAPAATYSRDLREAIHFELSADRKTFARAPRSAVAVFEDLVGRVDVLIGGPPCQGHSDLNNHSRRDDPKNSLYLLIPAFASLLVPPVVIIENVPAVIHDKLRVVETTRALLVSAGYSVVSGVVAMSEMGIAQRRRRHVLIATRPGRLDLQAALRAFWTRERSVCWAIADLGEAAASSSFDKAALHSRENGKRIDWLFDHDEYDLPNARRPACHRLKNHSYKSMYGRMQWTQPAQTITTGFGSPGQGRYIHPRRRRVISPHEAARLQHFPDSFLFHGAASEPGRTALAVMIGNAVPPKLGYVIGLAAVSAWQAAKAQN